MATTLDYAEFVCGQIEGVGAVRHRKMFGEFMIYVNEKPILLLCDNTVYVKMHPCLDDLCADCEKDIPYKGANEHYILDIEDMEFSKQVICALEPATPLPKPKRKKL
jgi:TfoX/Sxy family transcriptional regulator of competence genes